jgi:hypothetical protein
LQFWDPGEIIKNYTYVRQVYTSNKNRTSCCLFSSNFLLNKLRGIYDNLGIRPKIKEEIHVSVRLPNNPNPIYRDYWQSTIIKRSEEQPYIIKFDSLIGYIKNEVVLATNEWLQYYESNPGDEIIISPRVPIPELSYCSKKT